MRRKRSLSRLLVAWTAFLFACQPAAQITPPVTHQPTFTPLVVHTAIPRPTQTISPEPAQPLGENARPFPLVETDSTRKNLHFFLVQHARCAWAPAWCPIEQGILDAARELNVTVTLLGPENGPTSAADANPASREASPEILQETAALIDRASAAGPDGIALTIPDPVQLREPVLRAIASAVPVIAYHAGSGPIDDDLPYLTYLGMNNYQGGYQGGQRLIKAGARAGVCVNPAPVRAAYQTRCNGFLAAFTEAGLSAEALNVSGDRERAVQGLQDYAQSHPGIDAYLTVDLDSASAFYT